MLAPAQVQQSKCTPRLPLRAASARATARRVVTPHPQRIAATHAGARAAQRPVLAHASRARRTQLARFRRLWKRGTCFRVWVSSRSHHRSVTVTNALHQTRRNPYNEGARLPRASETRPTAPRTPAAWRPQRRCGPARHARSPRPQRACCAVGEVGARNPPSLSQLLAVLK